MLFDPDRAPARVLKGDHDMSAAVTVLTESTFDEEVMGSSEPVLVDFWAEWCGPCKTIAPILEELATEHDGALKVAKVNVDEHQGLALRFSIQSLPTMIVFNDGAEAQRLIGARSKAKLLEDLSSVL
jgi:thioredoxin 1